MAADAGVPRRLWPGSPAMLTGPRRQTHPAHDTGLRSEVSDAGVVGPGDEVAPSNRSAGWWAGCRVGEGSPEGERRHSEVGVEVMAEVGGRSHA